MDYLIRYIDARISDYKELRNRDREREKEIIDKYISLKMHAIPTTNPVSISDCTAMSDLIANESNIIADLEAIKNMLIGIRGAKK